MTSNNATKTQLQDGIDAKILDGARPFIEMGVTAFRLGKQSKRPLEAWGDLPPRSMEEIHAVGRQPLENLALALGARAETPHGFLHCMDYDLRDPAKKTEADAALDLAVPKKARVYVVRSGSGSGYHIYFFAPEPLPGQKIGSGDGWEVVLKGTGQYVVAPSSLHPDTGKPYCWVKGKRLEPDLLEFVAPPVVNLAPFQRMAPEPEPVKTEDPLIAELLGPVGPRAGYADIRGALEFVGDQDDRDTWLRVGAALHDWDGGGDSGFQLWSEWSERSEKFHSKDQRRTWKSLARSRGPRVTIASVFAMAREGGWCPWTDDDFPDLPEQEEPFEDLLGGDREDLDPIDAAEKHKTALHFITPDQCATAPKRGYIVKGLLAPRDIAAIVGAPGCGKSTVAPLIGYLVAQGKEAFGLRTKPGGVFYVAAEDEVGLQMRVAALRREHGEADAFNVVAGVSDLLSRESPELAALVAAVKDQRPSLIFLDTLAMAFPGLEENDAAAMGRVVHVARRLTKWGAAVVLIHHDTKAGDGLPRGHSILNGALDLSLSLQRNGTTVTGKLPKNRNGPCDLEIGFEIDSAELGEDEDGELVTAALCRPVIDPFADQGPRNASERIFMRTLFDVMQRDGGTEVDEKALRIELVQSQALSRSESPDSQRKAYRRVRDDLAGHGILSRHAERKTIKPLVSFELCFPEGATGQAGQGGTIGKCPVGTETGQTGQGS